jgi:hypothetical protein
VPQRAEREDDDQLGRDDRSGSGPEADSPALDCGGAKHAADGQADHKRRRDHVDRGGPGSGGVGSGGQAMREREGPDGEVQVVGALPEGVPELLPVVVRDREGDQQLGADDPKRDPERPKGAVPGISRLPSVNGR